jgi:hypothetical protein
VDRFAIPPDADVHEVCGYVGNEMNIHVVKQTDIGYLDGMVKEGDASVSIDGSFFSYAEDVLG